MLRSAAILLLCVLVTTEVRSAVPASITVQGRLTDNSGIPLPPGTKNFIFKIFDAPSLGTEVWPNGPGENQSLTSDASGLWIGLLGASVPLTDAVFADTARWLEITVDGTTLPRVRLVTGPYAHRVSTVDGASGGVITSKLTIGTTNTNTGADGFVAGVSNDLTGLRAVIAGGRENTAETTEVFIGGGRNNTGSGSNAVVAGGSGNTASGDRAAVLGGIANTASGSYTAIGAGVQNEAAGDGSAVVGGVGNIASGELAFVGGGGGDGGFLGNDADSNVAAGDYSAVVGGRGHLAIGEHSFIGGGNGNSASDTGAVVVGGMRNRAHAPFSFVGGGGSLSSADSNTAAGIRSVVVGGRANTASGDNAFVGGGVRNTAAGDQAVVAGGTANFAEDIFATVGGGQRDSALASFATIAGGGNNTASGSYSFVGGGFDNRASQIYATIAGGLFNVASGSESSIAGGLANAASGSSSSVIGGSSDTASGDFSAALGGRQNKAAGRYALAGGRRAKAIHDGAVVWADTTDADFSSTGVNQFLIRAGGGVGIGTSAPEAPLHVMESAVGGVAANASSIAVFERNAGGFVSILGVDGNPKGILFGDGSDAQRGGVVFDDLINNGLEFRVNGNLTQMVIDQDGDVGIRMTNPSNSLQVAQNTTDDPLADAWTIYSSRRWKENISKIPDALSKVQQLEGVEYDWKETGQHDIGLIAEDVGRIIPEVVAYEDNGVDARSVDYARLVALLIEGMKEQQQIIEHQNARLTQLEQYIQKRSITTGAPHETP